MVNINPILYRVCCSSCGALTILPIDILQTKILSEEKDVFKIDELRWTSLMTTIFAIQNSIYTWSSFIPNNIIRGAIAGLSASPPYIFLEIKKYKLRLNIYPKLQSYIFWMTLREIIVYITIYNFYLLKIPYAKFFSAFTANALGFPLRIMALKSSYPTLKITFSSVKKSALLEILKSSIGDGLTLYLIYNFHLSPLKI